MIVCISGTSRPGNYTARTLRVVHAELERQGAPVAFVDARDLELNFPGKGVSTDGAKLKEAVADATALVLATPEYHGGFCAMTKLIIENLGFPSELSGKPIALLGVAGGRIGAVKSLEQLRSVCAHTGAFVLPMAVSIAGVRRVFEDDGNCTDEGTERVLKDLAGSLLKFVDTYVGPEHRAVLEESIRGGDASWTALV
jgi:chromate reductase